MLPLSTDFREQGKCLLVLALLLPPPREKHNESSHPLMLNKYPQQWLKSFEGLVDPRGR